MAEIEIIHCPICTQPIPSSWQNGLPPALATSVQRGDYKTLLVLFLDSLIVLFCALLFICSLYCSVHYISFPPGQVSSRVTCDLLVITGAKTRMVEAGEAIHRWQFSDKMKHLMPDFSISSQRLILTRAGSSPAGSARSSRWRRRTTQWGRPPTKSPRLLCSLLRWSPIYD